MRSAPWEDDVEFCGIAAILWESDFVMAKEEMEIHSIRYSLKKTARSRMARRFEGVHCRALLVVKIIEMERAGSVG